MLRNIYAKARGRILRLCLAPLAIGAACCLGVSTTQTAVANGDTRTITFVHEHTGETTTVTFKVNGSYDSGGLKKLNWALRDWRRDEPTEMDPRLFDVLWEVYRELGISEVHVVSAYRSPETNAMLRRRSRAVARYSQHMLGKAMDTFVPGVHMSRVREVGLRLQRGGVGYYPTANTPFVHLDVGSVRHWPRMSYDQLARIFPDGKTVHVPTNGVPLARYEEARAEIERNGGTAYAASTVSGGGRGFFASLFGGGEGDEESVAAPAGRGGRTRVAALGRGGASYSSPSDTGTSRDGGMYAFLSNPAPSAPARNDPPLRGRGKAPAVEVPAPIAVAQAIPPAAAPLTKPQVLAEGEAVKPELSKVDAGKPARPLDLEITTPDGTRVEKSRIVALPPPPRRPSDLPVADQQIFAKLPTPPQRPVEFALLSPKAAARPMDGESVDAATASVAGAEKMALARSETATADVPVPPAPLPRVITEGGQKTIQSTVLAFAAHSLPEPPARPAAKEALAAPPPAAAVPLPPSRPVFTAAKIDRSNFRQLTAPLPAARAQHSASVAQPMRASIKTDAFAFATLPESGVASTFGKTPNGDLSAEAFTGPAIRPFATAGAYVEIPTGSIDRVAQ